MGKDNKRRNYFIQKDFQGKLILTGFLFVMGGALLFIVLLGIFSSDTLTISYSNHDIQLGRTPAMLLTQILKANWVLIAIGGSFLVIASMFLSHRIAGPLYRFERTFDNMLQGDLNSEIKLRAKDEGKVLAIKINEFNNQLSRSLKSVKANATALDALLEQAESLEMKEKQKETLSSLCWSMREHNKKITDACNSYSLKDE